MTSTATIRFYAELNDFIPSHDHQRDIVYEFVVGPSVKDAVEALGVPHTEVDLILVNGDAVDFGYRLTNGDHVSVYPVFERLDISDLTLLRPEPLREIRFIADGHLGTLARYLRLLGFDTQLDSDWSDDELAARSVAERRILLTRDRGLLKRRTVTHGLFVRYDHPDDQLLDVVRRLHLGGNLQPFTRCMVCNGLIEEVDKAKITDRLEPRTRAFVNQFSQCRKCGRVYWEGSHYRRLLDLVQRAAGDERSGPSPGPRRDG